MSLSTNVSQLPDPIVPGTFRRLQSPKLNKTSRLAQSQSNLCDIQQHERSSTLNFRPSLAPSFPSRSQTLPHHLNLDQFSEIDLNSEAEDGCIVNQLNHIIDISHPQGNASEIVLKPPPPTKLDLDREPPPLNDFVCSYSEQQPQTKNVFITDDHSDEPVFIRSAMDRRSFSLIDLTKVNKQLGQMMDNYNDYRGPCFHYNPNRISQVCNFSNQFPQNRISFDNGYPGMFHNAPSCGPFQHHLTQSKQVSKSLFGGVFECFRPIIGFMGTKGFKENKDRWEIPFDRLQNWKFLGSGAQGTVHVGEYPTY